MLLLILVQLHSGKRGPSKERKKKSWGRCKKGKKDSHFSIQFRNISLKMNIISSLLQNAEVVDDFRHMIGMVQYSTAFICCTRAVNVHFMIEMTNLS